ncbi:protein angel homolog 2 isoform X2 [Leptidea sinapis]|uniref:protein angel homolog 2 isoform X2 n=1 Tax=Leptidea sinapis TaxID=189913 RepID=UPI002142EF34|nr:protein angel homolog 2 isoform X2 [Leptidea sinapis]XP_050683049.1 protein angel homolog 2 isoform X2 [Leptidea sinapis]
MLKFTHSFCRYTRLTFENLHYNRTHAKKLSHLTSRGKTCVVWNYQPLLNSCITAGVGGRFFARLKNNHQIIKSKTNPSASKMDKPFSDQLHPTLHHATSGGQFEIDEVETYPHNWDGMASSSEDDSSNPHTGILPPDFRVWELVDTWCGSLTKANTLKFRVVSYNVLAQYLLQSHPYLYENCKPENLIWNVRAGKLFDEIMHLAPDILCLQEVQASHLNDFEGIFEKLGYDGLFKQKTRHRDDGCAIYIKKSQFEILENNTVEYFQPGLPVLNRDNVGLMVKLLPRCPNATPIVVATTHLLYNPKRTGIRLAQMQVLLAEIDRFAYFDNGKESGYLPIILTGDLNSKPDSAVIQLLSKGHVRASMFRDIRSDWRAIGVTDNCQHISVYLKRELGLPSSDFSMTALYNSDYSMTLPDGRRQVEVWNHRELFNSNDLAHPLTFTSVYDSVKSGGVHEVTTYQDEWVTVDYIFYSKHSSLQLIERLRLPTVNECDCLGSLPNDIYGSDHLAVAATFAYTPKEPRV